MGDGHKRWSACWCTSSSSSTKLLFFMFPLLVLYVFVILLGPETSNRSFITKPLSSFSSSSSSSSSSNKSFIPISHAKDSEVQVDLRSSVVDTVAYHKDKAYSVEAVVNSSFSPPLDVEVLPDQNMTKEQMLADSTSRYQEVNAMNESHALRMKPKREKSYSNLERLEAGLQRARAAIKNATRENQIQESEYVPIGPMYWDAKAFHRSYVEMEKIFKVFVYDEGEPPLFHDGPCKSIYSMEGNFLYGLEINTQFRTRDPERAHAYFLPFSVARMVHYVYVRDSHDFGPIKKTVVDYINLVAGRYSYWNRSLGSDHFMVACHDWGPETSFSTPYLHKNSIRALCNANTSEKFNPTKDVSIPEINLLTGTINGFVGGPSPSGRSILAFFAGGVHGPIRPILLEHWEDKDEDIKVYKYLPKGISYYEMLRKSKYCICPSGYEVASPRIVEAIYTGCVPVLISDHYVFPFSDVLNWKSFSVEVPVSEIPNLKRILMSISSRQYIRMQRRVVQIRRHFEFNSPPKRFDVFHMILHSIWLRRLNVRISVDQR
ncbi:Exostosin domain-containing protein [Cephalotus follicularis]|uniref:Exostosin domain-containing protein n=1 Tax=Cephalotus follicularis TaxID=3775 RepID=A0A1Q3BJM9_CEPFO|nr:Exostosin domain-containing protein [Cephalotus follicularis]